MTSRTREAGISGRRIAEAQIRETDVAGVSRLSESATAKAHRPITPNDE
jgi:hypothetical protein